MKKAIITCDSCGRNNKKEQFNSTTIYKEDGIVTYCQYCMSGVSMPVLGANGEPWDKAKARANHWNEIRSRVTTHEGQTLSGEAGRLYQRKWAKELLGKDLGSQPPIDAKRVEQYERTGN